MNTLIVQIITLLATISSSTTTQYLYHINLTNITNGLKADTAEIIPDDARRLLPSNVIIPPYPEKDVPPEQQQQPTKNPELDSKGDIEDLTVQETRHQNRQQSYNRRSKPQRTQYSTHKQNSNNKKKSDGKGGYEKSGQYKGKTGYSEYDTYEKASKDNYGDAQHKKYGNQGGNQYGHGKGGGNKHRSSYSDNADDYYRK